MRVRKLNIFFEDKNKDTHVKRFEVVTGSGIRNDASFGKKRQISILFVDTREWIEDKNTVPKGLCFGRFKENILIERNMSKEKCILQKGDCLYCGNVILRITEASKRCFEECDRVKCGLECKLKDNCCFAEVIEGGMIEEEMEICLM